jgi:hypothetical protein
VERRSGLGSHLGHRRDGLTDAYVRDWTKILADNGSPWYISGMSDPHFDDDVLHELDDITDRHLEVVNTTGLVSTP